MATPEELAIFGQTVELIIPTMSTFGFLGVPFSIPPSTCTVNGKLLLDGDLVCNGDIQVTLSGVVIPVPDPDMMKTFYSYPTNSYITANGGSRKMTSITGNILINGLIDGEGAGFESNRGPGTNSLLTDSTGSILSGYGATHAGLGYYPPEGV